MKKRFVCLMALAFLSMTGCTQFSHFIFSFYRKIEPCNFEINPPVVQKLSMRQADKKTQADIVGTWICQGTLQTYSKSDYHGEPHHYVNDMVRDVKCYLNFAQDGTISWKIEKAYTEAGTGSEDNGEIELTGKWICKNGQLQLTFFDRELDKEFTIAAAAFWRDKNTMDFRWDCKAYAKMAHEKFLNKFGMVIQSLDVSCYFDKDGSYYCIRTFGSGSGDEAKKTEMTEKYAPQTYTRQN